MFCLTPYATVRLQHALNSLQASTLAGAALAIATVTAAGPAHADSRNMLPRTALPAYTQECAACHMAFAPS